MLAGGILLACVALQAIGSLAVRRQAVPGSWPRAIPPSVARAIETRALSAPLDPTLRLVLARAALARGDLAEARAQAAELPTSHDKLALEARLALAAGDPATAARDAVRGHDAGGLQDVTNLLVAHREFSRALAVQRTAIAQLSGDPTEGDALAEAQFRLGRLEEMTAWRYSVGTPVRRAHEEAALSAYLRAAAAGPFVERYLLGLGSQAVNVGRLALAREAYERAQRVSPASADPYAGLGDVALHRGNRAEAERDLVRARSLDAKSTAVLRLAAALSH